MEILKCENVRKVYGSGNNQVVALDHIDLSVQKGEFVAIVGASGTDCIRFICTLLNCMYPADRPCQKEKRSRRSARQGVQRDRTCISASVLTGSM